MNGAELNTLLKQVESAFTKDDLLMILTGKGAASPEPRELLASDKARVLAGSTVHVIDDSFSGVSRYLLPNGLIAILFSLSILSVLIYGFLMMMDLQTPSCFPTESIDFGKIEK